MDAFTQIISTMCNTEVVIISLFLRSNQNITLYRVFHAI